MTTKNAEYRLRSEIFYYIFNVIKKYYTVYKIDIKSYNYHYFFGTIRTYIDHKENCSITCDVFIKKVFICINIGSLPIAGRIIYLSDPNLEDKIKKYYNEYFAELNIK